MKEFTPSERVRRYANNKFAHLSASPFRQIPTWDEVNAALFHGSVDSTEWLSSLLMDDSDECYGGMATDSFVGSEQRMRESV